MDSSKRNRSLYIDNEALASLALVKEGLISPVTKLMSEKEAKEVDESKFYKEVPFPFSFILAPSGKQNYEVLKTLKPKETVNLINAGKKVGQLIVDETFLVDQKKRLCNIYGTSDPSHLGVKNTKARLGKIAVSGHYTVEYPLIADNKKRINQMVTQTGAQFISSIVLKASPLNRAHERMIREALNTSDLLVIFLQKPFRDYGLRYDIRYNALSTFVETFLPRNRVIIVPFENTYIFAGDNELILDALLAKNYGCDQLIIGKNHGGLGLYYDKNRLSSVFDQCQNIKIHIKTIDEYVYCNSCNTLVSTQTCPHGQHHHVHYHSDAIMQLIKNGVIPPTILVRKEVSASVIAALHPNRFENLQELLYTIMPGSGLLEQQSEEQFYRKLIELYQTSSLT